MIFLIESRIWIIAILSVFLLFSSSTADSGEVVSVRVGEVELAIPKRYVLPALGYPFVPPHDQLDREPQGIILGIPLRNLHLDPPREGPAHEILIVHLYQSFHDRLPPPARHAWFATGGFENRVIAFDEQVGLYRVYFAPDISYTWQYFKSSPTDGGTPEESWVAGCRRSGVKKEKNNLARASCYTFVSNKVFESHINFSGANLTLLQGILDAYTTLLRSWEKKSGV